MHLLVNLLNHNDYYAEFTFDSAKALSIVQVSRPDIILLDVQMPNIDGYEVCERLKADEATCNIPVIFISASSETIDKVKAFSVGGVDYVTKPFQLEEVMARIETHLTIRNLQTSIEEKNQQLSYRSQELHEKNEMLTQTRHELKTAREEFIESEKMAALA